MPEPLPTGFGPLLRRLRRDAGLTQEELAERAGYSAVYISMLERGRREPAPETIDTLASALRLNAAQRNVLAGSAGGAGDTEPSLPGREAEQATIERHLEGGPPIMLLSGEPGIGKSALLRWTAERAALSGRAVLRGATERTPADTHAPLTGALREAIASLPAAEKRSRLAGCAWLVRLLPELTGGPIEAIPAWSVSPQAERRLMSDAVVRFLTNLDAPVLLLDDLQWAGRDALDLLAVVTQAASSSGVRILAAYRDTDVKRGHPLDSWIADMVHAEMIVPLPLGPLDVGACARVLARELGSDGTLSRARRANLLQRSGGVPFYLVSCAQAIRDGAAAPADVPWTVVQSIRGRLGSLPEGGEALLAALAVAAPAAPDMLAGMAGLDPDRALSIMDAATRNRLVEVSDLQYVFSHDLIREVVASDSTGARRARLHRRAAEYLEQSVQPPPVERLAHHLVRGGLRERAIPYLGQAGEGARGRYALIAAAGYFRELLDILAGLGRDAEAALAGERLAETLRIAAEYEEALSVLEEVERRHRESGDLEGIWRTVAQIGRVHAARGTAEEGIVRLQPVVPTGQTDPSAGLAQLLTSLARLHFVRGEYTEQFAVAEEAMRHARAILDDALLVDAMNVASAAMGMTGRVPESLRAYDEVIRLATRLGMLEAARAGLTNAAATYIEGGQFMEARSYVERAVAVAEQVGDPASIAFTRSMRADLDLQTGDWPAARADLDAALEVLRSTGQTSLAGQTLLTLARLELMTGDREAALLHLESTATMEELQTRRHAQSILAEIDIETGRPEQAIARLGPLLDRPDSEEWDVTPLVALLAEAHCELGDIDRAQALAGSAVRRARADGYGAALVDALRISARVAHASGDPEGALASLAEGITLARAMPCPHAEARLLLQRSEIEHAHGRVAQGQAARLAALAILDRLGADLRGLEPAAQPPRPRGPASTETRS